MSNKMDRQGVRTPADFERKYNFGKSFAEVNGIATDARTSAEVAKMAAEEAKKAANLSHDDVFRLLTNNGEAQGIFEKDGQIYINAAYIQSLEKMFAKDILMSGTFTNTMEAYLEPGMEEADTIRQHILGNITIPSELIYRYDFDGDGELTVIDMHMARRAAAGTFSVFDNDVNPNFPGVKSVVTMTIDLSNADKAIRFTGANMWGRDVESYVGVNFTNIKNREINDYIVERGETDIRDSNGTWTGRWTWEKWNSGIAKMYAHDNRSVAVTQEWGRVYRSGALEFSLPIGNLTSVDVVIPSCFGVEEAVWGGQARSLSDITVVCEVFCGNANTVNTAIHLEVIGKWK